MITRFSEMINNWMGWCPNVQMLPNAPTTTTIPGAPVQGEPIGGGDAGSTREYRHWRRGRRSLVPAGLLIGLGVGLLVGYVPSRRVDRPWSWIPGIRSREYPTAYKR